MLQPVDRSRREIPSVGALLELDAFRALAGLHGRESVVECVRRVLAEQRRRLAEQKFPHMPDEDTLAAECEARLARAARPSLRPVFNLTGTVLHTNLGRALYPESAVAAAAQAMRRPVNLEYDLDGAARGERDEHVEAALLRHTGAEAAAVVNNNAAAVYLALNTVAAQREVPVSRGELVEIGGSFRIPDIMAASGCILREVGTTNRTHGRDFENAISERTGALMKVHASNYEIRGFTAEVSAGQMAEIAHSHGLPLVEDLGCGMLVDLRAWGLPHEPTPRESLAAGADLVTFSGDKLLGGPQCGVIVGRKEYIARIRKNPMKRALRLDKVRLAALEAVLSLHSNPARLATELPTLRLLTRPAGDISQQARRLQSSMQRAIGEAGEVSVADCASQIGSGALPTDTLPSAALCIRPAKRGGGPVEALAAAFLKLPVPVVGRIREGALWLDLRCLDAAQEVEFASQLDQLELPGERALIVATAGHIDHGKTTLVKALTGVDTDRLAEEKARGISIDLGFAYWREPQGALVGFVDVPGHERFVHNMLAGVCGIDFVMLLVAADDGVMPQTREHLDIVHLLGIRNGVLVVTKSDRVGAERVEEVSREVRELVAGTVLAQAPLVVTSARSAAGVPQLRELLANAARATHSRRTTGRRFRFAVDRAFSVVGSGTVVTGTVFDGSVKTGDKLVMSPGGFAVRVRGIQKAGERADGAQSGERCALNLSGIERSQAHRGDWVLDPTLHAPGDAIEVEVHVLPGCKQGLRHYTPVHLHLGTQDVNARVLLRRGEAIAPGVAGFARIVADRPISALHGDRFILRDQSAQRTLAGGTVLDAFPARRRAPVARFVQRMQALALPPAPALNTLATDSDTGEDIAAFSRNFNLSPDYVARIVAEKGLAVIASREGTQRVVTAAQARAIELKNAPRELPENPEHTRLWQLAQPVLGRAGGAAMGIAALADDIGAKEAVLHDALHRVVATGHLVRVAGDKFILRTAFEAYANVARDVARRAPEGRFTAAAFRDAAHVGRTFAIQLLEAMDRLGVTRRIADARVVLEPICEGENA